MGCDIHPHFEIRKGDHWEYGPWRLIPHPEYWWENVLDEAIDTDKAKVAFGITDDPDALYKATEEYYKSLPLDQVEEKFGHSKIYRIPEWELNDALFSLERERDIQADNPLSGYYRAEIRRRDYRWFGMLAGVRVNSAIWPARGLPSDASEILKREAEQWKDDAHSHSHLLVSEILAEEGLSRYEQYQWLKRFIPDPQNTRMVFWFDN